LISGSMSAASASYNIAYSGSATTVTIGGLKKIQTSVNHLVVL